MTQGELEGLSGKIGSIFSDLEMRIMSDIVRRIRENGFSTASADWQLTRLQQLGKSSQEIKGWIREALEATDEQIEEIFSDEVYEQYYGHARAYDLAGMKQIPFEENISLQEFIEATKKQLSTEYENLGNSAGFAIRGADGHVVASPLMDFYRSTMDQAVSDITSGAFDYSTVLNRTIRKLTDSGLRTIDYDSGVSTRVDVAARRAVLTGFRQVQSHINEQTAKDLGTDSYEVSYHVGARPSHQVWQGRVYTNDELVSVCGLGDVTGLCGANCYHDYSPFIPGVSVRTYTDEQLEEMNREENTPKEYNGKEYTTYEALQQQRKMEREMRAQREKIKLLAVGEDEDSLLLAKAKYQGQLQTYSAFSQQVGLPEQKARITQDGLRGRFTPTKAELSMITRTKEIEETSDSAIIKLSSEELEVLQQYKSFESYIINDALRNVRDESELTLEQRRFIERLDLALKKIPKYEGNLIRTIDFSDWTDSDDRTKKFVAEFNPGQKVKIKQYWSASQKEGYNDAAGIRIYVQNAKNGRDISSIGLDEAEVLYERNQEFLVNEKIFHEGKWHILLTEV